MDGGCVPGISIWISSSLLYTYSVHFHLRYISTADTAGIILLGWIIYSERFLYLYIYIFHSFSIGFYFILPYMVSYLSGDRKWVPYLLVAGYLTIGRYLRRQYPTIIFALYSVGWEIIHLDLYSLVYPSSNTSPSISTASVPHYHYWFGLVWFGLVWFGLYYVGWEIYSFILFHPSFSILIPHL